jgi:formylaminopyrimidine deformylase
MIDRILRGIDASREALLGFVKQMIDFPTPDPPAHNTRDLQTWFAAEMRALGMHTEMLDLYPEEPLLVGLRKGSGARRTLIFNGHVDVAQVNPDEKWDSPPFDAHWDERYLHGRGSADMKAGLGAAFWALKIVSEAGVKLAGNVMIQSVVGEEAGERGTQTLIQRGHRGDFAIIPEPSELRIGGQGGVVTMWVIVRSPKTFHDGLRSRLIHAGGGLVGASAIEKMMGILRGMQELERHWAVTKSYPRLAAGANTINPAVIKGGRHPAFIADECAVWFTIHYLPNERLEDVQREVVSHIEAVCRADTWLRDNPPEIKFGGTSMFRDDGEVFPASEVKEDDPNVRRLFQIYQDVLGRKAESVVWPCVSDSGWFAESGIPVVICGPGRLEEAHAINEKIEIDQVIEAAKLYAAFIVDFCGRA